MGSISERIRRDLQADKYYEQQFANNGERFLAWYLRNVFLRTREQARADITDGQNDKQIDAVVIDDEQRRIVVLQGKFYDTTVVDSGPLQEILAAWAQIRNLAALEASANDRLRMKLLEIDEALKEDYEVEFELVTTGSLTAAAEADLASFQETLASFEHPSCTLALVDDAVLVTRLAEAESRDLPELQHRVQLQAAHYLPLKMAGYKTVVAAVPVAECLRLPGVKDGRLFRRNVRQALGQNKVNKGLKATLTGDQAPYFFLYHNGITALCRELTLDTTSHTIELKDLAVVNGCQSLTTMMQNALKVRDSDGAYVLFRFYEIPQRDVADRISALEAALSEYRDKSKILSPGNWLKSKDSVLKVINAVNIWLSMSSGMPGGAEMKKRLQVPAELFSARWSAE